MSTQPSPATAAHKLLAIDASPTKMYRWRCSCGSLAAARTSKLIAMKAWDEHVRDFDEWRTRHGLTKPAVMIVPPPPVFRRRTEESANVCSSCSVAGETWPCLTCGERFCDGCDPYLKSSPGLPCGPCTEKRARG